MLSCMCQYSPVLACIANEKDFLLPKVLLFHLLVYANLYPFKTNFRITHPSDRFNKLVDGFLDKCVLEAH